jgi:hypothetical protein
MVYWKNQEFVKELIERLNEAGWTNKQKGTYEQMYQVFSDSVDKFNNVRVVSEKK